MVRCSLTIIFICLMLIVTIDLVIYWNLLLSSSTHSKLSETLIYSDIKINSFNPTRISLRFNTKIIQSNSLSIIDNDVILVQLFQSIQISNMTIILSDGFHHLDISFLDETQNVAFYQGIDIASGTRSLTITVLDKQYQPTENILVHLELVDYSHITYEYLTNHLGEIIFYHLPRNVNIYIEAICMKTKQHAFVEINTLHYRNITLILQSMSSLHYDEYDPLDQGYYAI